MIRGRAVFFTCAVALVFMGAAALWGLNTRDESAAPTGAPDTLTSALQPDPAQVQRGAYLARAGNCMACHTARGGPRYAGGRAIATPFGTVYTSNLTPDAATGLGQWTPSDFWRALHNGRSKSGRLLNPVFPYTSYTRVTRADSDALWAYLKSLPAVAQPNTPPALRFPYNTQAALAVWRALYFKPGAYSPDSQRSADWNRGAYLVTGLGHCGACHTARDALGGPDGPELGGGMIPVQNWYAPSLTDSAEAGLRDWPTASVVRLLGGGATLHGDATPVAQQGVVNGPMTEVVAGSTQYLSDSDLAAMANYLKALPAPDESAKAPVIAVMATAPSAVAAAPGAAVSTRGAELYEQHCAQCHGASGGGVANAYPALAGNRAVLMPQTANLVQVVLNGGYAPATARNPRPFGMPPFVLVLDDSDIAAVLTHVRSSWGNRAPAVTPLDVTRLRGGGGVSAGQ